MKIILLAVIVCFLSCDDVKKASPLSDGKKINDSPLSSLPGMPAVYKKYMPDTSLGFSNWDAVVAYIQPLQKDFFQLKIKTGELLQKDFSDTSMYVKNQFTVLLDYLFIKHIAILPKTNQSISMLEYGIGVPGSIHSKRRLELFNSFPVSMQNNEIGKRVFKRIEDSFYDKNIGFSMLGFGNVELYDIDEKKKLWKELFSKNTDYKIIVFGASWCSPCVIQERNLKKYYTSIDASKIEIIGISIDNNINKFAAYLQRENFPWNTYRVICEAENPIMKKLDFTGIPRNFLIDSNGKIVKEDLNILEILKFLKIELKAIDVQS